MTMSLRYEREGVSEPFEYTITEDAREINAFPYKWFQATITNDDEDNDIYAIINAQSRIKPTIIKPGENIEFDFNSPSIWRVVLWTDPGKTANARIDTMR